MQKTAYEMRISDWISDVCSSDLMNFWKRLFSSTPATPKVDIARRFQLQEAMSKGSMSKVWKAIDTQTGRTVAVKVLDKEKTLKLEQRFVGKIGSASCRERVCQYV